MSLIHLLPAVWVVGCATVTGSLAFRVLRAEVQSRRTRDRILRYVNHEA